MTTISQTEIKQLLSVAGETFNREISPAHGRVFWEGLKNYDRDVVKEAFGRTLLELKSFPKPCDILERIEGNPQNRADIAWAGVLEVLRKYGSMPLQKMAVDGATAFAVERLGGIATLAQGEEKNLSYLAPRFRSLWGYAHSQGMHRLSDCIYGKKQCKLVGYENGMERREFLPHRDVLPPPTIAAPPQPLALESPEVALINNQISAAAKSLAVKMSLPK